MKKLFVRDGPGAGLVERPVRVSSLVSFKGEKRTLTERDLRRLAEEMVERAVRAAGPHDPPVRGPERQEVVEELLLSLHALGELDMDDVQAVQLGPEQLAQVLRRSAHEAVIPRDLFSVRHSLSAEAQAFHDTLLHAACLHILNFFTQRSTFVARTLVDQSRRLHEVVARLDLLIERTPSRPAQDARFEEQYARHIALKHSRLTIYGIDLNEAREWPLDTAYLSLEATAPPREGTGHHPVAEPVEQVLSRHERVLLRGVAGSGKTTLVQWLAVTTARQHDLTGQLAHLMGRVPFVLPLRTLTRGGAPLPTPAEFLSAVGCPLTGSQPQGWADRVLTAGRALLLVDGIDEVPEQERERTRRWLGDLLGAFPGNLWLVTSRPSAVREDWLGAEEFSELSLATMKRDDVTVFIERWHTAACAEPGLGTALLEAVRTKPDLDRLATNPLMCGLICALHRERRGFLPRGRKALYDAALSMLLERRDRERDMRRAGGIELDEESQTEILQKLAYWLIRNGRAEVERADAVDLIRRLLPSMPFVAQQGDAEAVFRHLLERSGLLREPARGSVDFVHRTFQDYLGARAAVQERDFDLLVRHAHRDQWEDVLRMAVAHARPDERARLLRGLTARGDAEPAHRPCLYLLAAACLEHATQLDPAVREEVEVRASELLPPRSITEARALAAFGSVVLDLLPGPEGLDAHEAEAVAHAAAQTGTDAALPLLTRFLKSPHPAALHQLAGHWDRFDTERYAREIIAPLIRGDTEAVVAVRSPAELAALRALGGHSHVNVTGDLPLEEIAEALPAEGLRRLSLINNSLIDDTALSDLAPLRAFPRLSTLELSGSPDVRDLSALAGLPLHTLILTGMSGLHDLTGLAALPALEQLLVNSETPWPGFSALPPGLPVELLSLPRGTHDLTVIDRLGALRQLSLVQMTGVLRAEDWHAVAAHPTLRALSLRPTDVEDLAGFEITLDGMERLVLLVEHEPLDLRQVAAVFPGLRQLVLNRPEEADLSALRGLPSLNTLTVIRPTHLHNAGTLPEPVDLTVIPRPRYGEELLAG